ncbi:MAG: hypothetical protein P3W91_008015, partial [Fervidobacterium sp.]|nr:hypothetical protein [Fervidobacterium sp.]
MRAKKAFVNELKNIIELIQKDPTKVLDALSGQLKLENQYILITKKEMYESQIPLNAYISYQTPLEIHSRLFGKVSFGNAPSMKFVPKDADGVVISHSSGKVILQSTKSFRDELYIDRPHIDISNNLAIKLMWEITNNTADRQAGDVLRKYVGTLASAFADEKNDFVQVSEKEIKSYIIDDILANGYVSFQAMYIEDFIFISSYISSKI